MRILFFSRIFGHTTFINGQVSEVASHHEVLYLYITRSNLYSHPNVRTVQAPFVYKKVVSKVINKCESLGLLLYRRNKRFRQVLEQTINDFKPDLIHCQFGYEALLLTENLGKTNIPILIHFRGYDASKKLRFKVYVNKLKKLFVRPNVHAAFVCQHLKRNLEKKGIVIPRYRIIHSNTDAQFFTRSKPLQGNGKKVLLQVSTLREKKGHEYTLKAIRLLIDQYGVEDFELVMTDFEAHNPRSTHLRQLITNLRLDKYVRLEGHLHPAEVKDLLEEAHAFLLHSVKLANGDEEGIPNAIMEAMAMNLPVVSTWHSGIPELVEDGVNGLLVPERDVAAYAAAIYKILDWPLLPHNRQKIVADFSRESHIKVLLDYYEQMVGMQQQALPRKPSIL